MMKYPKKTAAKKVTTKPKVTTDVVKLQKQLNKLTSILSKEKEIKEIDFSFLDNSLGQVTGLGVGTPPKSGHIALQLSNSSSIALPSVAISQGVDNGERIGEYINLKRMKWRMQIQNQGLCITPLKIRMEIWQLLGDPINNSLTPEGLNKLVLNFNQFYINGLPALTQPISLWDTTCEVNPQYKLSNIAKKIFTKKFYVRQEHFNTAVQVQDVNFNVDLKNMRTGFNGSDQLQCQYFVLMYCNTGNSGTDPVSSLVDPNYTPGLASAGTSSGCKIRANVRLQYLDD